ncbi:MAG: Fe-S cluster assembly protein SufD [Candidatus Pelagibacter sp.]
MENKINTDFEKTFKNLSLKNELEFKKNNLENFIKKGFPGKKIESWKFSDLNQIINRNIGELNFFTDSAKKNNINRSLIVKNFEHNKIVFINGKLEETDFNFEDKDKIQISQGLMDQKNVFKENSLLNLNNAFCKHFYKITIKTNYEMNKPLIVYHVTNKDINLTTVNSQLSFHLEKNSLLKIVDIYEDNSEKNFINTFYNFSLEENAVLKNFKIDNSQNNNIKYSFNNIEQEKNTISETFILSNGSKFLKNEINCNLKGKYSSAFINGIFSLNSNKHHEIRTSVNHLVENTKSYQLIKSVLDDKSKSVYQGKIYVNPEAQKTDGYQLSKCILLDKNTEFNAKPELEIYADDVKCSHGSASGSLNEDSIFYLRSRGLNYKQAKKLLIRGFFIDVIEKITDEEVKNYIKEIMEFN